MNDLETGQDAAAPDAAPAQDLAWERELVHLLSTLESFRARLHDDCTAGRALPAVETMLAVADGVAGFVRLRFAGGPDALLGGVQASADAFYAAARPLHDRLDDNLFKALWRLVWRRRDGRDPREHFAETAAKLRAFLNAAFFLCAGRFLSPSAAKSWTETYTVFLEDIDGLIEQVRP